MNRLSLLPLCLIAGTFAAEGGTKPIEFAQYRAVYDLRLEGGDGLAIAEMSGRLVIEVTGSACKGYSSTLRFVTQVEDPSGERQVTDTRSTTFEASGSRYFDFTNETYNDNKLVEESAGTAERGADSVALVLTKPDDKALTLEDTIVFPTEQLTRTIAAAESGEKFLQLDVYDGAENGEVVYQTTTVIGARSDSADVGDEEAFATGGFDDMPHWPLTVSYFDQAGSGDATPSYVMSMVLYRNGIGRNLNIDYGDFSLVGHVAHLELLPDEPCP
jgi:hypothetical protein